MELRPETSASFDRYIHAVEDRMEDDIRQDHFLAVDRLLDSRHRAAYVQLHNGPLYFEALHAHEDNHHYEIYAPEFRRSKLLAQDGDEATLYLQLYSKTMVTVTLNANFTATDTQFGGNRHQLALHSTRIAEVVNADKSDEHRQRSRLPLALRQLLAPRGKRRGCLRPE